MTNKREEYIIAANKMRSEWAANDAKRDAGLIEPDNVKKIVDIFYADPMIKEHLTDIYYPKQLENVTNGSLLSADKFPVIVSIHGGGWFYGDKELYRPYTLHLASMGFAVVNFNYRLSPEHTYPSGFYDVCYLMDFLSRNAEAYCLDMDKLFMVGDSAGAQLCSQYAILVTNPKYRKLFPDLNDLQLPIPQKLGLNCGIYDMEEMAGRDEICTWYLPKELTVDLKESFYRVIQYVTSDFPQSFLMLSVNDDLRVCTKAMKDKLKEQGVAFVYREFGQDKPEDGHVFHLNMRSENGKKCNEEEIAFFHVQ